MALNRCFSPLLASIKLEYIAKAGGISASRRPDRIAARSRPGPYGAEPEHDKEAINCSITDLGAG